MELSRQEYWSGLPYGSGLHLPDARIEPCAGIRTGRQILYHCATWEAQLIVHAMNFWTTNHLFNHEEIATDVSKILEYQFDRPFQVFLITYSPWIAPAKSSVVSLDPVVILSREWGFYWYFQKYTSKSIYTYIDILLHTCLWIKADILQKHIKEYQFSSVAQSCPTLYDPMNCNMPGLLVHHQLQESTQTHVHWDGDAIQPSHPLSSPSPPALNLSQCQGLFKWVSSSIRCPKHWSFSFNISPSNEHPGLISFRMDWLDLLAVQGTLKSLLQHHSSKASIPLHSAFFIVQLSHGFSSSHVWMWELDYKES